jgi:hypothetical protein
LFGFGTVVNGFEPVNSESGVGLIWWAINTRLISFCFVVTKESEEG